MARIDQETVNRILDAADIVEVVSDFVKLRRAGANYKGLCPFHSERTPSFSVNKARNICKCFSCGKGGSPVNFIMEIEQLSYTEALRYLARKYNIEIVEKEQSPEERRAQNDREAMLAVNDFALKHFEHNLLETDPGRDIALAYFRSRGISDAMIKRFRLGYSIDRGNDLLNAALDAGFKTDYLVRTGLSGVSERDGQKSYYDRFRSRVMFPVFSIAGRVLAFGGRTMRSDKTIAKYVNSPESEIYKKSNELYGLYQAKSAISKRDKCIMVEGYFDVISMHQAGVENVVASSGTSLTEGQIRMVGRFTNNVTLIYDADAAGIKASLRGINMLLDDKMDVKVLLLPPGDDPDSFAQSHSSSEVEEYLATHEEDIIAFMTRVLMKDVPPNDPMARAKVVNVILQSVAHVGEPVRRQEYISQCSRMLNIPENVLIRQLNIFITKLYEEKSKTFERGKAAETISDVTEGEETVIAEPEAPLLNLNANVLKPYEEMLARYLVRYGLLYFVDIDDGNGQKIPATVYDVISRELAADGLSFTHPPYAATFEAVRQLHDGPWQTDREQRKIQIDAEAEQMLEEEREKIRQTGGSMMEIERFEAEAVERVNEFRVRALNEFDVQYCQTRLVNSPDATVRETTLELIVDRYTISRFYARKGDNIVEQDELHTLVPSAIYELRSAIVAGTITDLTKKLAALTPDRADEAMQLLQRITEYKDLQKRLSAVLGSRIILPERH